MRDVQLEGGRNYDYYLISIRVNTELCCASTAGGSNDDDSTPVDMF